MVGREGLGAYVGGLGPLLGPMLAVLGADQGLNWRSWALCWRSWAKSGPNPSEEAIWQADQGGEVAQTRAGRPFWGGDRFPTFSGAGPPYAFFLIDISHHHLKKGWESRMYDEYSETKLLSIFL